MSLVSTTLTSTSLQKLGVFITWLERTYSLATAAQFPSGDNARARIGRVQRVSSLSKTNVSSEYTRTVPSSEPVRKKSFCSSINRDVHCVRNFLLLTVAAIARLFS